MPLILCACTGHNPAKTKSSSKSEKKKPPEAISTNDWKVPISIPKGEFFKSAGWLSEDQVLYITNMKQSSNVYIYHLLTGKSESIEKSASPIVNVTISPSKKYILIQSAPTSDNGFIQIIDRKGTEFWQQSIKAHELEFEWNPYDESKILVTNFNEDWSFKNLLIDLNKTKMTEISIPQPFLKWVDKGSVAYLKWKQQSLSPYAPLIFMTLDHKQEKTVAKAVFHFSAFQNGLMTIKTDKQEKTKSTYTFFDQSLKPFYSFSIPQLTNYSDLVVPFNDFIESNYQFLTFIPLESTEEDSYTEGFDLLTIDIQKGKKDLILKGMENQPLLCSPQGEACLYGNSLEKLIDLKKKKIFKLVKE